MKLELSRDDLDLTLKELKSQRVQLTISCLLNEAAIVEVEKQLKVLKR